MRGRAPKRSALQGEVTKITDASEMKHAVALMRRKFTGRCRCRRKVIAHLMMQDPPGADMKPHLPKFGVAGSSAQHPSSFVPDETRGHEINHGIPGIDFVMHGLP